MSRALRDCLTGLAGLLVPFAVFAAAPVQDGWAQWQTERATNAPSYCCIDWQDRQNGHTNQTFCDLNRKQQSISHMPDTGSQAMQMFAKFTAGKLVEVRSLGMSCEVRHREQARDLGILDTDRSLAILTKTPLADTDDRHDASMQLMSVALHPGANAQTWLDQQVQSHDQERRQDALFWLGQVRAQESRQTLQRALRKDSDEAMRRHACFVVAESGLPERFAWLTEAAKADPARTVRHEAWFWFGQSQPKNAEQVLRAALLESKDSGTSDHLVFVLSQLPAPRGTDALIDLLGDQAVGTETRKRALFWLGQSEDPRAMAALDRYL